MPPGVPCAGKAERALRNVLSSVQDGTYVQASDLTVAGRIAAGHSAATGEVRDLQRPAVQPRALRIPRLGDVLLQDLNAAHLNRLYSELLHSGRERGGGGLSPTTVRRVHAMLRKALNDAAR